MRCTAVKLLSQTPYRAAFYPYTANDPRFQDGRPEKCDTVSAAPAGIKYSPARCAQSNYAGNVNSCV
jgi:hypothetical protein